MCESCWEDLGSPTELSDAGVELAGRIEEFYQLEGCETGGPLHVVLDDWNLGKKSFDWRSYNQVCPHDWSQEVIVKADTIISLMSTMKRKERAAALAKADGFF